MQARPGRHAQLQLAQALIGSLDIARLFPGRRHQRFLMLLNDPRAERRHAAMARIEVQLVEPVRRPRVTVDVCAPHATARKAAARAADPNPRDR